MPQQNPFRNLGRILSGRPANDVKADSTQEEINRVPGAEPSSRLDPWWWLVAAVAVLIILMAVFSPDPYWKILLYVRDGVGITVLLTVVSFVFILLIGLIGGLGRIAKNRVIHLIASLYVEIIRGVPLLVQLIWWYFAAPVVERCQQRYGKLWEKKKM